MKHLFYISLFIFLFITCQKTKKQRVDIYTGQWNFDVKYQSINNYSQTVYRFEGNVVNLKHQLTFYYGLSDYISANVDSQGVLHNSKGELIGVIEKETCLLDFNENDYHIKIKGFKNL